MRFYICAITDPLPLSCISSVPINFYQLLSEV